MLTHPFAPVYDEHSEILILGTFPSVKSRENEFYYGHSQNRFWKVLESVFAGEDTFTVAKDNYETGEVNFKMDKSDSAAYHGDSAASTDNFSADSLHLASVEEKKAFLLKNHIALWDVIKCCEITGSADSTITNVTANDIAGLLRKAPVRKIYCNGNKAWELFQKYIMPLLEEQADLFSINKLPSTSPANAAWSLEKLIAEWKKNLF